MIVVDSSVWINLLRRQQTASADIPGLFADPTIIIVGDIVLLEVLRGARDEAHAAQIESCLRSFRVEPMLDAALAVRAARNYRSLRSAGVTVSKVPDLLIATFCVTNGCDLVHDDKDFDRLAAPMGLRVLRMSQRSPSGA